MFTGKTNNQLTRKRRRNIAFVDCPQGKEGIFKLSLAEEQEAVVFGWSVGKAKQGEFFQLIDKTLF